MHTLVVNTQMLRMEMYLHTMSKRMPMAATHMVMVKIQLLMEEMHIDLVSIRMLTGEMQVCMQEEIMLMVKI